MDTMINVNEQVVHRDMAYQSYFPFERLGSCSRIRGCAFFPVAARHQGSLNPGMLLQRFAVIIGIETPALNPDRCPTRSYRPLPGNA